MEFAMLRIEDYFPPAFYKQNADGKFEVFVIDLERNCYDSIGVYEHESTAARIMGGRTYGACAARQWSGQSE